MNQPLISIDRASRTWAVFDGWEICKEFCPYESEEAAIEEGKAWVAAQKSPEPEIAYPKITKMVLSTSRRRRAAK